VEAFGTAKVDYFRHCTRKWAIGVPPEERVHVWKTHVPRVHRRVMRRGMLLFTMCFAALSAWAADPVRCPPAASHMHVDKGEYAPEPGISFGLTDFTATMVPRGPKIPLCLVKINDIQQGRIFVTGASLTKLFQSKNQGKKQPIQDMKIETKGDHVVISGKVHKVVSMPFSVEGPVTASGRMLRLDASGIKAAGLPIKGLLAMIGKELGSMFNASGAQGVSVKDNTIFFEPEKMANIRGQIADVKVTSDGLLVTFATARQQPQRSAQALKRQPAKAHSASQ
jgi:hypothetical protein